MIALSHRRDARDAQGEPLFYAKDLVPLAWYALFQRDDVRVLGHGAHAPLVLTAPIARARATFAARAPRLRARLSEPLLALVLEIDRALAARDGGSVEALIHDTWIGWSLSLRPDLERLLAIFDQDDEAAWKELFTYIDAHFDAGRGVIAPGRAYDTVLGHPAEGLPPYPRDAALFPDLRTALETLRPAWFVGLLTDFARSPPSEVAEVLAALAQPPSELGEIPDDHPAVRDALRSDDPRVRAWLATEYAGDAWRVKTSTASADPVFHALASDPDERVRAGLLVNLNAPPLLDPHDPSPLVRALHPSTTDEALIALADAPDPPVRAALLYRRSRDGAPALPFAAARKIANALGIPPLFGDPRPGWERLCTRCGRHYPKGAPSCDSCPGQTLSETRR
jgi:hypothetical protein